MKNISVREIEEKDIVALCDYWFESDPEYMHSLGVDISLLPERKILADLILGQISKTPKETAGYVLIWEYNNQAIGHSNINSIFYGEFAFMHLHLWNPEKRKKGMGTALVKKSLPFYFENFKLKKLYCTPYALNPAPNKTLAKVGFKYLRQYLTTPGSINFEQEVKEWCMTREQFLKLNSD